MVLVAEAGLANFAVNVAGASKDLLDAGAATPPAGRASLLFGAGRLELEPTLDTEELELVLLC